MSEDDIDRLRTGLNRMPGALMRLDALDETTALGAVARVAIAAMHDPHRSRVGLNRLVVT